MSNDSPVPEYNCLSEVISEVRETFLTDIVRHTLRFSEDFKSTLIPEPIGVYLPGRLEPLVSFDNGESYWTDLKKPSDIFTPEEFIHCRFPIFNKTGQRLNAWRLDIPANIQPYCSFNYSATHIAVTKVWDILRSLHRDTRPNSMLPRHWLDEMYWVKPEDRSYYLTISSSPYDELEKRVLQFIDRDFFSIYTLSLNNTCLNIAKGNDFRVIAYYRQIFEDYEAHRFETRGY